MTAELHYAVPSQRLLELMEAAGFAGVRRVDSGFYQPVLVGTRGHATSPQPLS